MTNPDPPAELAAIERQLWRLLVAPNGVAAILEELGEAEGEGVAEFGHVHAHEARSHRLAVPCDQQSR